MVLERPPICRACLQRELDDFVVIPDFEYAVPGGARYGRCPNCGSLTQAPMPSAELLASYYPPHYHSFLPPSGLSRLRQKFRIKQLQKSLGNQTFRKTLLDFGCGQGLFLNTLANAFPEGRFLGYEIGDSNVREDRFDGRVTIFRGDPGFFWELVPNIDIVTMNHVIEHLPEPLPIVQQIYAKLVPGGRLEGQTPNAESFERSLFGARWSGFHSPRHTVVFSAQGLETLLRRAGFEQVTVRPGFNPGGWAVSLASLFQNKDKPRGVRREGATWLAYVLAAVAPAFVESKTRFSGMSDFNATKTSGARR
jgi:SAM-dependent methyltransferase